MESIKEEAKKFLPRLIKLLELTTSDNDNEALQAMRAANKMLKKVNLSWQQVVELLQKPAKSVSVPTHPAQHMAQQAQQYHAQSYQAGGLGQDPFKGFGPFPGPGGWW